MTEPSWAPAILIIDEDVGFLWWLGELFHEAGYQTIPSLNCSEALSLARNVKGGIDLVLVHPGIRGVRRLITALSGIHTPKVILLQDSSTVESIPGVQAAAILQRPAGSDTVSRQEWRQRINSVLQQIGFREAS